MADNTLLNAGSGGDTVRDLDRTGVKTQIVALDLNPAGGETLMAGTMPVSAASLPLPTGAATSAKQDTQTTAQQAIQTSVELIDDAIKADDAAFTPATTKVMMAGLDPGRHLPGLGR